MHAVQEKSRIDRIGEHAKEPVNHEEEGPVRFSGADCIGSLRFRPQMLYSSVETADYRHIDFEYQRQIRRLSNSSVHGYVVTYKHRVARAQF